MCGAGGQDCARGDHAEAAEERHGGMWWSEGSMHGRLTVGVRDINSIDNVHARRSRPGTTSF